MDSAVQFTENDVIQKMMNKYLNDVRRSSNIQIMSWTLAVILATWPCQSVWAEVRIEQRIVAGKTFMVSDGTTYDSGERLLVNRQHQIPDDMIVQGDTVLLTASGDGLNQMSQGQWRLTRGCGKPKLIPDPQNPLVARFVADGYGVNEIIFEAVTNGSRTAQSTNVFVEFSTDNMLVSGDPVSLPGDAKQNPFVDEVDQKVRDHREQVTARNPHNGRLVTMWQVKFGTADDHPMGVATMTSDDHGITWTNKQYVYRHEGDNSGWGSLGWSPGGNEGKGEFLLWTCSHVRSPGNRIMLFRSRDDGRSWQHVGDYQKAIAKEFGQPNALLTYFGVNRTIATLRGRLLSPMVCHDNTVRIIRSDDNGLIWLGSNLGKSFPEGNEDALVETIDGGRLILMARRSGNNNHNRRFESVDGGITWTAKQDTTLPTARVNFGLDKIVEPNTPEHGQVVYASAASRILPHGRRQLVVALNRDPFEVTRTEWDVRLLWDTFCNYADVLYLPDDKSLFVTVETLRPGRTAHSCAAIRYFKMSLRYWRSLPLFVSTSATGGSQAQKKNVAAKANGASPLAPVGDNEALPRVLLIGDSISIGYTLPTREALAGKANVHRPPVNCCGTPEILNNLKKWLASDQGRWDVIHFNSGIHDIKRPGGNRVVTPEEYGKNLRIIVKLLKNTGAELIWCSTTLSPEAVCGAPAEDFVIYNTIAENIMKENGIAINDLYSFSLPRLDEIQIPVNSHFTPEGYKVLATQVSAAISKALETRKPKRNP